MALVMDIMNILGTNVVPHSIYVISIKEIVMLMINALVTLFAAIIIVHRLFHPGLTVVSQVI